MFFRTSTFEHQNPRKYHPKGPKGAPATPKSPQNPSPMHPKSDFLRKVKTLENIVFYYGLGTMGRPGVDVLAIKTAIVAPTTDRTPKNGENVGPKAPKVAQVSPNGAPGGVRERTFSTIFHQFPSSGPLGTAGVPETRFFVVWDLFLLILGCFRHYFWC